MPIVEEESSRHGVAPCCRTLEVPRASFYRWRYRKRHPALVRRRPAPARAHSRGERQEVLSVLNSERFRDVSVPEVLYTCLEEGRYLASPSTAYRLLKQEGASGERRNQLIHPVYPRPELLATRPNQVWSWDITKILTFEKWTYIYLYVLMDIFSRYVVGWLMAPAESATLARELIAESYRKQAIRPRSLTVHADRGSSMRSKTVAQLLCDLDIRKTHSRPHVSNDNPFSESQFKTMKYCPIFPGRVGSIQEGRSFGHRFFPWYNNQHRHSGIAYLTPAQLHYGKAQQVLDARHRLLLDAAARHPERFVHGAPKRLLAPSAVWINPPRPNATVESTETH